MTGAHEHLDRVTIGVRRTLSIQAFLIALVLLCICVLQIDRAISRGSTFWWIITSIATLAAIFGMLAALFTVLRRKPVIVADEAGVSVSVGGLDRTMLPWNQIAGFELVGKGMTRSLVVLALDPEAAIAHVHPAICSSVREKNKRYNLPGAVYIPSHVLAGGPQRAVDQLRAIAQRNIPPLDASMPHASMPSCSSSPPRSSLPSPLR